MKAVQLCDKFLTAANGNQAELEVLKSVVKQTLAKQVCCQELCCLFTVLCKLPGLHLMTPQECKKNCKEAAL